MRILVALDGSKSAETILPQAVAMARATSNSLTLIQAIEMPSNFVTADSVLPEDWYSEMNTGSREYLDTVAKNLSSVGTEVHTEIVDGKASGSIIEYAKQHSDITMIAMASHGRDEVGRFLLGSTSAEVLQNTNLPLLLIHPDSDETHEYREIPTYRQIVVPLATSAENTAVFNYAMPLAKTFGASFTIVQGTLTPDDNASADSVDDFIAQTAQYLQSQGFTVQTEAASDDPAAFIKQLNETERGNVLVMGPHEDKIEGIVMKFIGEVGVPVLLVPLH